MVNRYYILSGLTYTHECVPLKTEVTIFSKPSKVMSIPHVNMSSISYEMGEVKISYHPSCDKVPHPGPHSSYLHETLISDAHIVCNDICSVETNTQDIVQTQRDIQSKPPGSATCKETFPL